MSEQAYQDYEAAMNRLYVRNQEALPEEDRCPPDDQPSCSAIDSNYVCTKLPGHLGDHVAHGTLGNVCHRWPQEIP